MYLQDIDDNLNIEEMAEKFNTISIPQEQNDIMVIGVGGGGGDAINHMFRQGVEKVTFVVCNTDEAAIAQSPVPNKVVIGDGRGAGNDPSKARKFAEEDIEKIYNIFDTHKAKMAFITAGMGGGTGTGAAPVVARVAKERGLLTIGIVTIPFIFEGRRKIMKALDGADEMAKYVDALLIINNQRLAELHSDLTFLNAFAKADDTLSTAARSISEIITIDGYINLDFEDVDSTLRNGGTAIISTGYGEGEHRVSKAIENALQSPLLKYRDIYDSKKLLFNLYMSDDSDDAMAMGEVEELENFVSNIDREVDVIWGCTIDKSLGNKVKITILASGFDVTLREEEKQELTKAKNGGTIYPGGPKNPGTPPTKPGATGRMEELYGPQINELSNNYVILELDQLDDDSIIEKLEKYPTYNRDRQTIDTIQKGGSDDATPSPDQSNFANSIKFV